jgi:succinoglycan biosynthesis transport protein ExoP
MRGDELDDRDGTTPEDASGLDLRAMFAFVRRRRVVILVVALPLLIPALLIPFLIPKYYEATATIELERRAPVLEIGRDVLPDAGNTVEAAIVTLVTSDAVLGIVLDQVPESAPGRNRLEDAAKELLGLSGNPAPSGEQMRQMRLEALRRVLRVGLAGGKDFLAVTATGSTGANAAFLANAVAEAYVRYLANQRESASQRAVAWLNQQIYELRDQTTRKEQAVADLVAQGLNPRAFSAKGDEDPALALLEQEIQGTRIELAAAKQRLAELSPAKDVSEDGSARGELRARLDAQFATETANLDAARLKYTPTHPEVRRLEAIVAELRERGAGSARLGRAAPTPSEIAEYQTVSKEKGRLESKLRTLSESRNERLDAGQKSDAYSRYRRLESELAIDRDLLGVLLARRNETMLASAKKDGGAQILDPAVPPLGATGPKRSLIFVLGLAGAIAAGVGVAILLELLDNRLRDPDRIAQALGMSSLCILPTLSSNAAPPERQAGRGPGLLGSEGYSSLRTALMFAMRAQPFHTLLITSAIAGEGKTTTSANLAAAFARMGKRVVLVDADMRRPRLHRVFNLPRTPGVSEVLVGSVQVEKALVNPQGESFDLLTAGSAQENPADLLGSAEWSDLMADLKREYDLVLIDSPVLLAVPDSLLLAAQVNGVILVHKPGSLDRRGLNRTRADLRSAGARVLGIVFNQVDKGDSELYPMYLESPYVQDGERKRSFWTGR